MKVIHARADVGEDRTPHVPLPADTPTGPVEVLVVLEPVGHPPRLEERRTAARAGRGALKSLGLAVDEFRAERRADELRREAALGQ